MVRFSPATRRFLATLALGAAACSSAAPVGADAAPNPGRLVSTSPAPHPLNMAAPALRGMGLDPGPFTTAEGTHITYTTTAEDGSPREANGIVLEAADPTAPTLVMAPGTRGQGDQCSPSGSWLQVGNTDGHTINVNYELPIMYLALAQGWRVVMTDYIGLGTPDQHRYVNAAEQGHAVLDAARATTHPGQHVALYGYSQGGGATGAAAEQAPTYAPDVTLDGAFVGAPPADLRTVSDSVDRSFLTGALAYAMNAGATEPAVAEALERSLNEKGKRLMAEAADACTTDSVFRWGFQDTREYTVDGASAAEVIDREPALSEYIDRQKLGRHAPAIPTMVASNRHDDLIPWRQAHQLAEDWCARGATVEFRTFEGNAGILTHATTMFSAVLPAFEWIKDRFNGAVVQPAGQVHPEATAAVQRHRADLRGAGGATAREVDPAVLAGLDLLSKKHTHGARA